VSGRLDQARRWLESPGTDDRGLGKAAIALVLEEAAKVTTSSTFLVSLHSTTWALLDCGSPATFEPRGSRGAVQAHCGRVEGAVGPLQRRLG
jgi:hypothetical protein